MASTPTPHDTDEHGPDSEMLQACIEECLNCHVACTTTAQYCLAQGGEHADADHVGLLLDCADICQTSANFMLRGSPYHPIICLACAELCRACEESCRSVDPEDAQMRLCAESCASCAEHCERMAETEDEGEETEEA
ncbi:MAG TPA: four-helix bundle copper-binding protein [Gemmatimonadaceae bacterium]|nr:four-helix bundle copper-binding protein [Gemmatimonadaceae bacterium]